MVSTLVATLVAGCALDRAGLRPIGRFDGGADAGRRDGGADAGRLDGGFVWPDSGLDAGPPPPDVGPIDAGPPPTEPPTGGLVLHFDGFNVHGDGSTPTAFPGYWTNLVNGENELCPATEYRADGIGPGLPALRTTGVIGSHCYFPRPIREDLTLFLVFRSPDTRAAGAWFNSPVLVGSDQGGNATDAALVLSGGQIAFGRSGGGLQVATPAGVSYADDAPHIVALTRVAADGAVRLWVDGGPPIAGSTPAGGIGAPLYWRLAGHDDLTDGRLDCSYGELLIYDRVLTEEEVLAGRRYLRARWRP